MTSRLINFSLIVLFISLSVGCKQETETTEFRRYILMGRVHMINNCTNNLSDLPEKILIDAEFDYTDGEIVKLYRRNKPTSLVSGKDNEKQANYMFRVITNKFGDNWRVTRIRDNDGEMICNNMSCENDTICQDNSENVFNISTMDDHNNPFTVKLDFLIKCECGGSI